MELIDARRLTGPNVLLDGPGTVLDVAVGDAGRDVLYRAWQRRLWQMLDDLGWQPARPPTVQRPLAGGLSMAFAAPIDALYVATEVNEWAFAAAVADLAGAAFPGRESERARLAAATAEEANPELLALAGAARRHGVTLLWDDDHVSLGMGRTAQVWPARELPAPADIDWGAFADVPAALVTGTNGKTTTVRLAGHIAMAAGRQPGLCSTDWIAVGNEVVDRGDWSGPGGARAVLRHRGVDAAILEAARGGLLRRGLGVERAAASVITNIAEDHLGDFGSRSLDELLDIKWVVSRAVRQAGVLVLNADDPRLVARARDYDGRIAWFSLQADNPQVRRALEDGKTAWLLSGHELQRCEGRSKETLCRDDEMPLTLSGAARHNVANALAAAALCEALGIGIDDIREGLTSMQPADNPGRCNVYTLSQCRVLVDFAHNPHAMQALFAMARALPAERRLLAFAQAGDRTDLQIRELAERAWAIGLDHVAVSELEHYLRGRAPGEVYDLIRETLLDCGARDEQISHFDCETASLDHLLSRARPGDLVIMLALADSAGVRRRLEDLAADAS